MRINGNEFRFAKNIAIHRCRIYQWKEWATSLKKNPFEAWKVIKNLLHNTSANSNPISGSDWEKHFEKLYVHGIEGNRDTKYIESEEKLWKDFIDGKVSREDAFSTKAQVIVMTIKALHWMK